MKWEKRRKLELLGIDLCIAVCSYYLIMAFHMLGGVGCAESGFTYLKLLIFGACLLFWRILVGVYHSIWRYANSVTYLRLVFADGLAGFSFLTLGTIWHRFSLGFTNHLLVSSAVLLLTLCSRFFYQRIYTAEPMGKDVWHRNGSNKIKVAIVGAGDLGASLAGTLARNPKAYYTPYCFVDDDPKKIGQNVNGLHVLANDDAVVEKLKKMPVQEIIIALPDLSAGEKERLYEKFSATGCKVKLYDYSFSEHRQAKIREFRVEELLFRESIHLKNEQSEHFYSGKTVLVTGGGGSIGSELCRQIAKQGPKQLVILDIYENNAYDIQQELIRDYGNYLNLDVVIASVRDRKRLEEVFCNVRPDIVIHAAAHKHVPLMEHSPTEAIKNNVFGTYNCADLAEKYGVKKFLLISTDKAVNPTNIMGASKRLCEMVIQCRTDSRTEFAAVRFGNVLGSNGSVIPLFRSQIEKGGPVTLTDKRIVRYFMTIPEAISLVLEAGAMAKAGDLFVLDMGKPVKILDLAENMIRMAGYTPYQDINIVEIGLRPGEKLYEELLMKNEELTKTPNKMIFIEHDKGLSREEMETRLALLHSVAEAEDVEGVYDAVRRTVPTYRSAEEVNRTAQNAEEMKAAQMRAELLNER